MIKGFAPDAPDEPFAHRIHQWRTHSRSKNANPSAFGSPIEGGAELVVAIADKELRPLSEGRCVSQLLDSPCLGWSARHPMRSAVRPLAFILAIGVGAPALVGATGDVRDRAASLETGARCDGFPHGSNDNESLSSLVPSSASPKRLWIFLEDQKRRGLCECAVFAP